MATVKHEIAQADGWVEIAADGTDFLMTLMTSTPVKITYQDAAPAADAPYHLIKPDEALVRVGTGAVYAATANGNDVVAIVTT